jgi:hypothetical protein
MKPSWVSPAVRTVTKLAGYERMNALLIALTTLLLPPAAQAALPKYAFSVPAAQSLSDGAKAAETCGLKGKIWVMPALSFHLANDDQAGEFQEQTAALMGISDDAEVFLRVKVGGGTAAATPTESQISDRVAAFLKRLPLSAPPVRGLILEIEEPLDNSQLFAFALVDLAVAAKGTRSDLRVTFALPAGFTARQPDLVKRLATYADFLGIDYTPGWEREAKWIAEQALNKPIVLKLAASQPASYLAAALASVDTEVKIVWADSPDAHAFESTCAVNNFVGRYIVSDMTALPAEGTSFSMASEGLSRDAARWFKNGRSGDIAVLARVDATPGQPKTVKLHGNTKDQFDIQCYDPLAGTTMAVGPMARSAASLDQTCVSTGEYALIFIHALASNDERSFTAVDVKGKADLTVEEIVARWQQYREAQRQKLDNYTADCFLNLHFESTNVGSGFDISMQYKEFSNRDVTEWAQTDFFVNGSRFSNKREFPLPQLEPEKVMTKPLELTVNEKYQYKLLGTEKVDEILCYVVSIEPKVHDEVLYSGKIWIDGETFRQVKQYLRQRGSKSNVVSNVETQDFELVSDDKGNQFNLLKSIKAQQLLNAAGRDFVLQKTYSFSAYHINATDFDGALAAMHSSDSPMFRETDEGLRALIKRDNQRVLDTKPNTRVRAIVVGTMYSGTFNFPIPIAGYSLSDFNWRNTGDQLSIFFAGPILASNLSRQYGTKFRLGVDLALSGLPGNNRVYSGNTELTNQTVWTWEEDVGLRATWQATTSLSLTASEYVGYQYFHGNSDTSKLFVTPRNGVVLMPSAQLKFSRRGYIFTADATRGQRLGWTEYGFTTTPVPLNKNFTKYDADFNKSYYIGKFTKAGWDFSYYGGDQLDRFSRYWPWFFSTPQLHGIPGGVDSFDAIAMGNVNYGFDVMEFFKVQALYSYARARNTDESRAFKEFDGLELNISTAGPFGTFVQGTISYALDGNIPRYNSRWGALIMIFKPLH